MSLFNYSKFEKQNQFIKEQELRAIKALKRKQKLDVIDKERISNYKQRVAGFVKNQMIPQNQVVQNDKYSINNRLKIMNRSVKYHDEDLHGSQTQRHSYAGMMSPVSARGSLFANSIVEQTRSNEIRFPTGVADNKDHFKTIQMFSPNMEIQENDTNVRNSAYNQSQDTARNSVHSRNPSY